MSNLNQYKTKQRQVILDYIEKNKDKQITANDILLSIGKDCKVSQTTIYRYLDMLVKEGKIKKYYSDEESASCYQYIGKTCNMHYHLKCTKCGEIFHVDSVELNDLEEKLKAKYDFKIDNIETILYGVCKKCQ